MSVLLLIIILLVLSGGFGGWGYYRRADWGPYPVSVGGILVFILLIWLILHLLPW